MSPASRNGRAHGQIVLIALVFFGIFIAMTSALISLLTTAERAERVRVARVQALHLAEAGFDKAVYELNRNGLYTGESGTALGAGAFTVAVTNSGGSTKKISVTASVPSASPVATRTVTAKVSINTSVVSFRYGVQAGEGGVSMGNGSRIEGDLFSDGPVEGGGSVTGTVIVASSTPPHTLSGIAVGGDAYAHTLSSCTIAGDAYYASTNSCEVGGTAHPGTPDTESAPLPVSDAQIDAFKAEGASGGTIASYSLSNSEAGTLGPREIIGNMSLDNGSELTLTGTIYVHGNASFSNNARLIVSPILGDAGAVIVVDGAITLANGVTAEGNGNPGSTVLLLSTNSSGSAISLSNNAVGALLYAAHGGIAVANNGHARQITGYRLQLANNAVVTYDTGLQNQNFSNGPGGSWAFVAGSYGVKP